jgi:hypothetical protein
VPDPQQSTAEPAAPSRRRRRPPNWLIGASVAAAAIVAVVVVRDGDTTPPPDLSTPQGAAEAFAMAAATDDVDGVLATSCLGDNGCATAHGGGATTRQIATAKKVIADNLREIGGRLRHAEFTTARAGTQPGTQEVDYRLPGVPREERNYLVFVHYQDRWLYIATGGPATPSDPTTAPTPSN